MNKVKKVMFVVFITLNMLIVSSCWNYKELNNMAIVTGFAVDWNDNTNQYIVTVEIINPMSKEKEANLETEIISMEGEMIFDAVRNIVMKSGKKLYWSHAKVLIISKKIAEKGIVSVLDWVSRDAEVREDMWLIVSWEETAKSIYNNKPRLNNTVSYELDDILRSSDNITKYESTELWHFTEDLNSKGLCPTVPSVRITEEDSKGSYQVLGTAILKKGTLTGWLNDIETRSMRWIKNEVKGGILIAFKNIGDTDDKVSLEVLNVKTKLNSVMEEDKLIIEVDTETNVVIGEIGNETDYISEPGRSILKAEAENQLKSEYTEIITKAQKEYRSDIFGFGQVVQRKMPKVWKEIEGDWEEVFSKIETRINVTVNIKGSALKRYPLIVEE